MAPLEPPDHTRERTLRGVVFRLRGEVERHLLFGPQAWIVTCCVDRREGRGAALAFRTAVNPSLDAAAKTSCF
jgi:hypothetical protein